MRYYSREQYRASLRSGVWILRDGVIFVSNIRYKGNALEGEVAAWTEDMGRQIIGRVEKIARRKMPSKKIYSKQYVDQLVLNANVSLNRMNAGVKE